jgi:rhodanese-related sulfurtransferase
MKAGKNVQMSVSRSLAGIFLFVLLAVPSLIFAQAKGPSFTAMAPREALDYIRLNRNNPNFVLLDVRTPEEFEEAHIEGAININYHAQDFVDELKKLNRNKTYLVYCRTGNRSGDTLNIMKKLEFKEVYRIEGDIIRWKKEKLPVISGSK